MMYRTSILIIVAIIAGAVAAPLASAAALPTDLSFRPRVALNQGLVVLRTQQPGMMLQSNTLVQWRGISRFRSIDPYGSMVGHVTTNIEDTSGTTTTIGTGRVRALSDALVTRNSFVVAPDQQGALQTQLLDWSLPLITRQRSGDSVFTSVRRADGRTVLRARMPVAAISCAGVAAGFRTVELDPATFLPVRVLVTRRGKLSMLMTTVRMRRASGPLVALRFTHGHPTHSDGFVLRTPAAAAGAGLPFTVSMPSVLPDGFALARTGSAKMGGMFGPEGSFPRANGMFAAQWRRGLETLDFTIRSGATLLQSNWDDSEPFGYECGRSERSDVMVSGHPGRYALGEYGGGRLWWRDGATMYSLTAPLPKDELVRVAQSLVPVSAS